MKGTLYGLLGERLSHSISPQIHSAIMERSGIKGSYHLFEVERPLLGDAVRGLKALGAAGANVTIPYKSSVIEHLDKVSAEAQRIGAVNTIDFKDGLCSGYNTDYFGFEMMLRRADIDIKGRSFLMLGTGGAAKAVAACLEDFEASRILAASTNVEKAKEVLGGVEIISYDAIKELGDVDVIVNCTPLGMHPNTESSPLDEELLPKFDAAVDLIYNPRKTLFLAQASRRGLKAADGLYMLVGQAVKAQEIWNDMKLEQEMVDEVYEKVKQLL